MSSPTEPLIVFIHLQRTGGSTLDRMLLRQFGDRYRRLGTFKDYDATLRRVQEVGRDPGALRVVRGHMTAGVRQWLPEDARFVTFLRTPVDRVVSHYRHLHERKVPVRPFGLPPMPSSLTLEECVAEAEYIPDNLMTRMLSDAASPLGDVGEERLEEAKRNLRELFTVVGLSERYDESLVLAQTRLGLPRATYRPVGVSKGDRVASLPDETLSLIRSRNALDEQLYAVAVEVFEQQLSVAAADERFAFDLEALRLSRRLITDGRSAAAGREPALAARAEILALELRLAESEHALALQSRMRVKLERRVAQLEEKNTRLVAQARHRPSLRATLRRALRR